MAVKEPAPLARPADISNTNRWAMQQPGVVSGQWLCSADRRRGTGIVIFASQDAATSAVQGPRNYPRDDNRAWNIERTKAPLEQVPCRSSFPSRAVSWRLDGDDV